MLRQSLQYRSMISEEMAARSRSWTERADMLAESNESSGYEVFIFRWIALACLCDTAHRNADSDIAGREKLAVFVDAIAAIDSQKAIAAAAESQTDLLVRCIADAHRSQTDKSQKTQNARKLVNKNPTAAVKEALMRIYALRNAVIHGKVRWNSSSRRRATKNAAAFLKIFVPLFADVYRANRAR